MSTISTTPTRIASCILISILWAGLVTIRAADLTPEAVKVSRWQPRDFDFRCEAKVENPFQVTFTAEATGPGGIRLILPGFYDGNSTWKVRFAPAAEGEWSLQTHSQLAALDNRHASVMCTSNRPPNLHGGLRVDPQYPRHFVFEDGRRYFLMGYECDWLWALDLGKPDLHRTETFLDKLAAQSFNYVILNAYAHDTDWRKGKTGEDDFGPPAIFAWEGTNEQPDHTRFNLAYWRHYDRVIDALCRRGMSARVMIKVYNKKVNWPAKGSPEDDQYFRWLIARYAAYPNINWDFSKEANNEKDLAYKLGRLRFLRQNDPYHRLLTAHDDRKTYDDAVYNELLDYRSDQQHSKWHASALDHRHQRNWPLVNVEFGYEHGPGGLPDTTYEVVQAPEEVCRRAWEICLAGAYTAYYYTYTAWDVIRPQDTPPGYAYFRHLRDFFAGTAYWRMEPHDDLVSEGYCLAEPGREYVIFLNQSKSFSLKLEGLPAPLQAEWYQPLTGKRQKVQALANGTAQLQPPADWGDGPIALHVGSSSR
ncbi:MAG: DUF4038 domain-containing protein [Verrucomicrobia bacterium]|nr:DUF4038 domain-containing protein [Verrucomicrobiota bacterium]